MNIYDVIRKLVEESRAFPNGGETLEAMTAIGQAQFGTEFEEPRKRRRDKPSEIQHEPTPIEPEREAEAKRIWDLEISLGMDPSPAFGLDPK
jgi:hypothetical protein